MACFLLMIVCDRLLAETSVAIFLRGKDMTLNRIKIFAVAALLSPLALVVATNTKPVNAVSIGTDDPAIVYKSKCAACHSAKADKFFDPAKADDELIEIVLKGKKGEKPPFMPGFEAKGMTPDEAKGLVEFMKGLKKPAS